MTETQDAFINILIAEDNDISREMMGSVLRTQGFRILGAEDGGEAIEIIQHQNVDMAFVDINMAPQGGFEFIKYLLVKGINLPVVIVTSDDSTDILEKARELGVEQVLQKPVDPQRLIQVTQRTLKRSGVNPSPMGVEVHETKHGHEFLMQRAIEIAEQNTLSGQGGGPYGAVVADQDGHILGEGFNGITSRADPTAHAEVMAIRQAAEKLGKSDLSDCNLYVSSEPTMMGKALIISVGIKQVFYGLSHEDIKTIRIKESKVRAELSNEKNAETTYTQIGHDEALAMFKAWQSLDHKAIE